MLAPNVVWAGSAAVKTRVEPVGTPRDVLSVRDGTTNKVSVVVSTAVVLKKLTASDVEKNVTVSDVDTAVDCGTKLVPVRTTVVLTSLVTIVADSTSPLSVIELGVEGAKEAGSVPVSAGEVRSPSMPEGEPVPLGETVAVSSEAEPEPLTGPLPDADFVGETTVSSETEADAEIGAVSVAESDPEPSAGPPLEPDAAVSVCDDASSASVPVGKALVPPREDSDGETEPVAEPLPEMSAPVA